MSRSPKATPDGEGAAVVADQWGPLETEIRRIAPAALKPQAVNARFMTAAQMDQLVANIRADGRLTSLPLAYADPNTGVLETLSGHHRAEAAGRAGLDAIDVIVVTTPLSEQRKAALQLSHNAITGQDDPATLAAMYAGLDLDAKTYSGLDDSALSVLDDVSLAGVSIGVKYREMNLFFLDADAGAVTAAMADLDRAARKNQAIVASYADFEEFFDLVVRAKTKFATFNSAMAVRMLIDLARAKLEEMESADAQRG